VFWRLTGKDEAGPPDIAWPAGSLSAEWWTQGALRLLGVGVCWRHGR